MVPLARDNPTHRHAHSRPTVPPLTFTDQQYPEAAREHGSNITFHVPQQKSPRTPRRVQRLVVDRQALAPGCYVKFFDARRTVQGEVSPCTH